MSYSLQAAVTEYHRLGWVTYKEQKSTSHSLGGSKFENRLQAWLRLGGDTLACQRLLMVSSHGVRG